MYLGKDITDGLFAWIQIGVNVSADWSSDDYYGVAASLEADGGHESSSSAVGGGMGGGNGTGMGNGTSIAGGNGTAPPS